LGGLRGDASGEGLIIESGMPHADLSAEMRAAPYRWRFAKPIILRVPADARFARLVLRINLYPS
jgi:hypothetical protein